MELEETIDGMLNDDYKERFKAEYRQLRIRLGKLSKMLRKYDEGVLEFTPSCPIGLLKRQYETMYRYAELLEIRALIEHIDLSKKEVF